MSQNFSALAPLSPEERAQLQALLIRSQLPVEGSPDAASSESDWGVVTAGMTDASKRRQELSPERNVRAMGYQAAVANDDVPLPKAAFPLLANMVIPVQFGTTRRGAPVMLPPGVPDLDTWGRTMIEFGKLSTLNISYLQVVESSDPQMVSYVKWCKGQVDCSDGLLKDLGIFILAHE